MNLFINHLFTDPSYFFAMALLVMFSISFHEFCHAWVALREGDPTAADAGHLTLNPLKQMGLVSLFMFAIVGIAWGQVPVNPHNFRRRYSDVLVSFAGPAANLILVAVFAMLTAALVAFGNESEQLEFSANMLWRGSVINVVLFIFNLLPVPGFDGWNVFSGLFPRFRQLNTSEFVKGAVFVVLMLAFFFIDYLFLVGRVVAGLLTKVFILIFERIG